jgi:S1-C subfamily serine protease
MDWTTAAERPQLDALLRSVVKVMTVSDEPDYDQPWQTSGPAAGYGSGVIVETSRGLRVLTNGHCVQDHVFIELRRYGDPRKYVAEVEALGHECDLALLRLEDEAFFDNVRPMPFGGLPDLSERVQVYGYPVGGDRLSITQGIVSRMDLLRYTHSQRRLLGIQIDAAINDGNSGGPVVKDGRLIGIAFQSLEDAEQISYVIPTEVVQHFVDDVERGVTEGFPDLGVVVQRLESDAHRRALGLHEEREDGVLVIDVAYGSSAWGIIEPGDVILEVDGVQVASDGTVQLRDAELVDFDYIVSRRHTDETMNVKLWRDGCELDCVVALKPPKPLVAESRYDVRPSYYVFGGLLFAPLTRDYLATYDDPWWRNAPEDLMALYERGIRTPDRIEPVVLQKVLADWANQGYHDLDSCLVSTVQDRPVHSLRHLVHAVEASRDDFIRFGLADGRQVVIDRASAVSRHTAILERYGVPRDRSVDLEDTRMPNTAMRGLRRAGRRRRRGGRRERGARADARQQ